MFDRDAKLAERERREPDDRHSQHFRQEAHSSPHDPIAALCEICATETSEFLVMNNTISPPGAMASDSAPRIPAVVPELARA